MTAGEEVSDDSWTFASFFFTPVPLTSPPISSRAGSDGGV